MLIRSMRLRRVTAALASLRTQHSAVKQTRVLALSEHARMFAARAAAPPQTGRPIWQRIARGAVATGVVVGVVAYAGIALWDTMMHWYTTQVLRLVKTMLEADPLTRITLLSEVDNLENAIDVDFMRRLEELVIADNGAKQPILASDEGAQGILDHVRSRMNSESDDDAVTMTEEQVLTILHALMGVCNTVEYKALVKRRMEEPVDKGTWDPESSLLEFVEGLGQLRREKLHDLGATDEEVTAALRHHLRANQAFRAQILNLRDQDRDALEKTLRGPITEKDH